MSLTEKLAPAVRKETKRITSGSALMTVVMLAVFAILHLAMPKKVPFDYRVVLGALGGCAVAVLNFFLMAVTMQKAASAEDETYARKLVSLSYTRRMGLMILWGILAILLPCFQFVAGALPLLFPGLVIRLGGILKRS